MAVLEFFNRIGRRFDLAYQKQSFVASDLAFPELYARVQELALPLEGRAFSEGYYFTIDPLKLKVYVRCAE
jgi:hypothetical protein